MRRILFSIAAMLLFVGVQAQTLEEYKSMKAEKEAAMGALAGEIAALDAKITGFPGWNFATNGTVGLNFSNFSNWVNQANPNSQATTILGSYNAYARLNEEAYFWRNAATLGLGWQNLNVDKNDPAVGGWEQTVDVLNINSLFGYKITSTLAASAMGEYRTTVLNNFNNPGYLDIGVGATWTPMPELVVVFHPLNYNYIFSNGDSDFVSSLGCKVMADYAKEIYPGIAFRSNLTGFLSYNDFGSENSLGDLSNFTWTNGLSFTAFKGIGVGIEYAIRQAKQETNAFFGPDATDINHFQNYLVVGLSYAL